jgi:hypothetical protein
MSHLNREHLRALADRCERGADELQRAADDPAGVLAERGYHDHPDAQEWGQHKQAAATAARQYAAGLRAEADALGEGQRPTQQRIQQAEKVATAAVNDGILIDKHPADHIPAWDTAGKQAHADHAQQQQAAIEGSGLFEQVAEQGQVPYWQMGHTDQDTPGQPSNNTDDNTDEA